MSFSDKALTLADSTVGKAVFVYIAFVSAVSVICCIRDKINAKRHKRRTAEKNLLILCALGGSVSMYITMLVIRHKTKRPVFMLGIPAIILLQLAASYLLLK